MVLDLVRSLERRGLRPRIPDIEGFISRGRRRPWSGCSLPMEHRATGIAVDVVLGSSPGRGSRRTTLGDLAAEVRETLGLYSGLVDVPDTFEEALGRARQASPGRRSRGKGRARDRDEGR